MHRLILPFAAASLLTAASIATAHAHVVLQTSEAAPGSYKAVLKIPHGCDGQPTDTVRIDLPEGYVDVRPMLKPGWTITLEKGDYAKSYEVHGKPVTSGVKSVTWSGGNLPDDFFDEFVVSGTLAGVEEGQTLFFKARQACAAAEILWDEEPAAGQDPHSLDHPAPSLTIMAAASGEGHHHQAEAAAKLGDLEVSAFYARAMLPGQPAGGAYLTIANNGKEADRLVSVASPHAGKVEIHSMEVADGVMVMRPVANGVDIPAGGKVELKPGGLHVMFMDVTEPFKEGATVPLTLQFDKAGSLEIALPVKAANGEDHSNH